MKVFIIVYVKIFTDGKMRENYVLQKFPHVWYGYLYKTCNMVIVGVCLLLNGS